jgi:ATP-dependent DNA ligase
VTTLPLLKRKELLNSLPEKDNFVKVQFIEGNVIPFYHAVVRQHFEGVVLKRKGRHQVTVLVESH